MVIFIKKLKVKDGINNINVDKIRKELPAGCEIIDAEPQITYTANNIVLAFKCRQLEEAKAPEAAPKKAPANKKKTPATVK